VVESTDHLALIVDAGGGDVGGVEGQVAQWPWNTVHIV
jgi:hypothetical protein